jgi:hypothetical protein
VDTRFPEGALQLVDLNVVDDEQAAMIANILVGVVVIKSAERNFVAYFNVFPMPQRLTAIL